MPRRKRVARAVYAVFVILVGAFVASSIAQVAFHVFGAAGGEVLATGRVGDACARAIGEAIDGIDRARTVASAEANADVSRARYANERAREGKQSANVEAACSGDPRGTEALAALARLDRAAEAHAIREARDLSPVRLAAQSFISGPNR
jgi:hypothetical protein